MSLPHGPKLTVDWSQVNSTIDNPYWKLAQPLVANQVSLWGTFTMGDGIKNPETWYEVFKKRQPWTNEFSWAITDPLIVNFVAEHCTKRVIDPMAGTGYWAYLLRQMGIKVLAFDRNPPRVDSEANHWHRNVGTHVEVRQVDAVAAAQHSDTDDTLLLVWPPYDDPIGFMTLQAFHGNRLIYIGEGAGGCTGDDLFHALLESEWEEIDSQTPVQWDGIHDVVWVYDRIQPGNTS